MPLTGRAKTEYQRQYMHRRNADARTVEIRPPKHRRVREHCRVNFRRFCELYFPEAFPLSWSDEHLTAITKMQDAVLRGGLFAIAMPRGSGKTTLAEAAALWAILYSHRLYVVLIGATEKKAEGLLKDLKSWMRYNERLAADFPEICRPIVALEGIALRAKAQTAQRCDSSGNKVGDVVQCECEWTAKKIVLPTVKDSPASGSVIEIAGLTGDIRGRKHTRADGSSIRPDFVICDDPQTKESAGSKAQTDDREEIVQGDVLGLAGPGQAITCVMPCTIIEKGDLADRFLDRKLHPDWQGETTAMVPAWPKNMEMWDTYADIRRSGLESGDNGEAAKLFYRENMAKMDEGARVSWDARRLPDDVSALQHAMDLYYKLGKKAFMAEYQNDPIDQDVVAFEITAEQVANHTNAYSRYEIPGDAHFVVTLIDINRYGLHHTTAAFGNTLGGYVLDYGKYPRGYDTILWDAKNPKGMTEEQAIFSAMDELLQYLQQMPLHRGGHRRTIDIIGIDCGYKMDAVFAYIRANKSALRLHACRGRDGQRYKATRVVGKPRRQCHITEWEAKGRVLVHNTDYWRENMQRAWLLPSGVDGSLSLWGKGDNEHTQFSEQITAEKLADKVEGKTGWMYKWTMAPGARNDLGDCMTGCMVLAHALGADYAIPGSQPAKKRTQWQRYKASYTEV